MHQSTRLSWMITPVGYFLQMLLRPTRAIHRICTDQPSFWALALFLTSISLLRGLLDGLVVLLNDGQLVALWATGRLLPWFVFKAYPLILADWLAVYVRWLGFALVPYVIGRLCGGQGRLSDLLRLYGVILGIYVVTPLPNFAYFFMPLPQIRFAVAPQFTPSLGVGNVLTSLWLAWVTYLVLRQVHGLPWFESIAVGVLTPLLNIAALVLPGALLFNLPAVASWNAKTVAYTTLLGFSVASIVLIGAALGLINWLQRREQARPGASATAPDLLPGLTTDSPAPAP